MKRFLLILLCIMFSFMFLPASVWSDDPVAVIELESDVKNNKAQSSENNSRIQGLEDDLEMETVERIAEDVILHDLIAVETADRIAEDFNLQTSINDIELMEGPKGDTGTPGISSAFCSVVVEEIDGDTPIQDAINSLDPTSDIPCTVLITPGEYRENVVISKNYISLVGAGYESTILNAKVSYEPTIKLDSVDDIKISGLSIVGAGSVGIYSDNSSSIISENQISGYRSGPSAIYFSDSIIKVDRNIINDNIMAIYAAGSTGKINQNIFINNGEYNTISIAIDSSQIIVSENDFNEGGSIKTDDPLGFGTRATISNNTFINVFKPIWNAASRQESFVKIIGNTITRELPGNVETGISNRGPAIITENLIEHCGAFGIIHDADETTISNNVLRHNGILGSAAISSSGTSTITGNSIENNEGNGVSILSGGLATVTGNTFKNNGGYGVNAVGMGIVMGNAFIGNGGCINYNSSSVVAANLCETKLAISGDILSENLTIEAENDLTIIANDVNIQPRFDLSIITGKDLKIDAGANIPVFAPSGYIELKAAEYISTDTESLNLSGKTTTLSSTLNTTIDSGFDIILSADHEFKLDATNSIYLKSEFGYIYYKGTLIEDN